MNLVSFESYKIDHGSNFEVLQKVQKSAIPTGENKISASRAHKEHLTRLLVAWMIRSLLMEMRQT